LFIFVTLFVANAFIALCHPLPSGLWWQKAMPAHKNKKNNRSNAPLRFCAKNKQLQAIFT